MLPTISSEAIQTIAVERPWSIFTVGIRVTIGSTSLALIDIFKSSDDTGKLFCANTQVIFTHFVH